MFKSIFSKYLAVLSAFLLGSFIALGSVWMIFSMRYWEQDKQTLLSENARQIADFAAEKATPAGENQYRLNASLVPFLDLLVGAIDAEALITDNNGTVILCSDGETCAHVGQTVPQKPLEALTAQDTYFKVETLGSLYETERYVAAVRMVRTGGQQLGYVFLSISAQASRQALILNLRTFAVAALVALALFLIVMYILTYRLVKPLRRMAEAARKFGAGDFADRIAVKEKDEIGALAQAMNNMADSLASAEGMRRGFIASVSHELRTPMTTISGFVDGILDGTIPPEQHRHYLQIVSSEVKRLSRLVQSMLSLSRMDAGEMRLNPVEFDLTELAGGVLLSFEDRIEKKGLRVEGGETAEPVLVQADRDLIGQVVYNLVENAVKFSDEGGTLRIATRSDGRHAYFTLRNTGPGIAPEEMPHIFQRFYKSDASRSLDKTGMGLGLYLVRQILTLHGGEITVRSVQGSYCEFEFWLPKEKYSKNV
ncbi:MAG: HAMP domain-containing histidine kinase [Clostridia bacterium]|nr:HAMP domain-containing histidine kinase [Clostridia bacterium]